MKGLIYDPVNVFVARRWAILLYLLKVFFYYSMLWFLVVGYNGLVDPHGVYDYSASLGSVNFLALVCDAIVYPASWVLKVLNYATFIQGNTVGVIGSGGVKLELPCLGVKALISLSVLIACYPSNIKNKIVFLVCSLPVLHVLNILRITILAVFNYTSNPDAQYHYQLYDYVIYAYIAFALYVYVEYFTNKKQSEESIV